MLYMIKDVINERMPNISDSSPFHYCYPGFCLLMEYDLHLLEDEERDAISKYILENKTEEAEIWVSYNCDESELNLGDYLLFEKFNWYVRYNFLLILIENEEKKRDNS